MNKDSNIRIDRRDRQFLRKIAKAEGRTLKVMFGHVIRAYHEKLEEKTTYWTDSPQ